MCIRDSCTRIEENGTVNPLTDAKREEILGVNQDMAQSALRVIGVAYRLMDKADPSPESENDLIFVGLVGMIDPPREEAKEAIDVCKTAGIQVKMITGDHKITASAIGAQLGIETDRTVEGREINEMTDEQLRECVKTTNVFARVSPEHKVRLVDAVRAKDVYKRQSAPRAGRTASLPPEPEAFRRKRAYRRSRNLLRHTASVHKPPRRHFLSEPSDPPSERFHLPHAPWHPRSFSYFPSVKNKLPLFSCSSSISFILSENPPEAVYKRQGLRHPLCSAFRLQSYLPHILLPDRLPACGPSSLVKRYAYSSSSSSLSIILKRLFCRQICFYYNQAAGFCQDRFPLFLCPAADRRFHQLPAWREICGRSGSCRT